MSYDRWNVGRWHTFWVKQRPGVDTRETAMFVICPHFEFTAAQLRADLDMCLNEVIHKVDEPVSPAECDELAGYMREFLAAVDDEYPPDSA